MRKAKRAKPTKTRKAPLNPAERAFFERGRALVEKTKKEMTEIEAHISQIEQTPPEHLESIPTSADRHEAKERLLENMRKALEQKREDLKMLNQQIEMFKKKTSQL